jgi:hypothetical protein
MNIQRHMDPHWRDFPHANARKARRSVYSLELALGKSTLLNAVTNLLLIHSHDYPQNFLLAFFTPFIVRSINFSYGFVFAGCNLLGAIVVWMFLYESSGLSLEAIDLVSPSFFPLFL